MKKNKGLKITALVLGIILVLMAVLPFAFEGKVKQLVKTEGNKMLNARFDFKDLNISLFRNFPNASVTLDSFYMVGIGDFEKDTLVSAGELTLALDLMSLFRDRFDIGKIFLSDATVHAIVLENGKVNWDVMKPDTTSTEEEAVTDTSSSAFSMQLKKLAVKNLNVTYDDYQQKMHASVKGFEAECSGDFSADLTDLELTTAIEQISFRMGVVPYLSNAKLEAKLDVNADLKNKKFTFQENSIQLNAIKTSIDGWLALPDTTRMDMDLKLNTNEIGFKELLSLIPAIYSKDFESLKTDGKASLKAWAKGTMQGDSILPAFDVELKVSDAMFRYPSLPAGVDAIQITAKATNPGGSADKTVIEINPFSFRLAGMPFSLTAFVKTPMSDPDFKASAKGTIDLANIKKVYPLENEASLTGVLTADVQMQGRLSYAEKEQYDRFQASGKVNLKNMFLKMKDMKDVQIKQSTLSFTPQNVKLSQTDVLIGKNDLSLECTLENYLAYVLKGKTIRGTVNLSSNYLNLADFSASESTPVEGAESTPVTETSTTELSVIEVPRNVDFKMQASLKKVLFDTMTFENVNGLLLVKDATVDMKNLSLQTMGGTVTINGAYSTAESVKKPKMNGAFSLNSLSFAQTYKELDMVRNMAPIFENLQGSFSGSMDLKADLDEHMSPILESMNGSGTLSTKDINLSHIEILQKIATLAKKNDLLAQNVKDMNIRFVLKDGKMITEPFTLKLGKYSMQLEGTTGLDKSIAYKGTIALPGSENSLLSSVALTIGGTFASPKISLDTKSMANQAINAVTNQALDAVSKKLGVDLSSVEKQKDFLVSEAQKAGAKLVEGAQNQANKLIADAGSNPLKLAAAKMAAKKLVETAQKESDNLVRQAEEKGNDLIEKYKMKGE